MLIYYLVGQFTQDIDNSTNEEIHGIGVYSIYIDTKTYAANVPGGCILHTRTTHYTYPNGTISSTDNVIMMPGVIVEDRGDGMGELVDGTAKAYENALKHIPDIFVNTFGQMIDKVDQAIETRKSVDQVIETRKSVDQL